MTLIVFHLGLLIYACGWCFIVGLDLLQVLDGHGQCMHCLLVYTRVPLFYYSQIAPLTTSYTPYIGGVQQTVYQSCLYVIPMLLSTENCLAQEGALRIINHTQSRQGVGGPSSLYKTWAQQWYWSVWTWKEVNKLFEGNFEESLELKR